MIVAFASALRGIEHERDVAFLFVRSLVAFTFSLVDSALEVRIGLGEFDHHG
jgi:hypothetical protein